MDHPIEAPSIPNDQNVKISLANYCEQQQQQQLGQTTIPIVSHRILFVLNVTILFCFIGFLIMILLGTVFEPLIPFILIGVCVYFAYKKK